MLVDDVPFTHLTAEKVESIVTALKAGVSPREIADPAGTQAVMWNTLMRW